MMNHEYDVIVAGGGPAGVAAAVAAARNGSRTLLIEREGYLGGMATIAGVPAFGPYSNGEEDLIGGIGREILERMKQVSCPSPFYDRKPDRIEGLDWVPIDPEALKRVLDEMAEESGCHVLLHTVVTGVRTEEERICDLTVFNKGGDASFPASYFIDCTGDADVAAMAGADWEYGDEDGSVQAGTLCFRIAGMDTARFMAYAEESGENGNLSVASEKARDDGNFPEDEVKVCGIALQADGVAGLNFGHVYGLKPLDPWSLSNAERQARSRLPELMKFLHQYVPGMEHCVLVSSGPYLGIRESRRIMGHYVLTAGDYSRRADFEDAIAYYSYPIDMHGGDAEKRMEMERLYQQSKYKNGECYGIPYRCLIPKGFHNLAVAGRTISADRTMMASVRVMCACFATGQAAGTAAALCGKTGTRMGFIDLDAGELRAVLRDQGACRKISYDDLL